MGFPRPGLARPGSEEAMTSGGTAFDRPGMVADPRALDVRFLGARRVLCELDASWGRLERGEATRLEGRRGRDVWLT